METSADGSLILGSVAMGFALGLAVCAAAKFAWKIGRRNRQAQRQLGAAIWPLETHLVLNVFGRLAIAVQHDDHAQDGVEVLANYLRAVHLLVRRPPRGSSKEQGGRQDENVLLRDACQSYWALQTWFGGRHPLPLHWREAVLPSQSVRLDVAESAALLEQFQQALNTLQPSQVQTLELEMRSGSATDVAARGSVVSLLLRVRASEPPCAKEWHFDADGTYLRWLTLSAASSPNRRAPAVEG